MILFYCGYVCKGTVLLFLHSFLEREIVEMSGVIFQDGGRWWKMVEDGGSFPLFNTLKWITL